jgi:hypothetical protein
MANNSEGTAPAIDADLAMPNGRTIDAALSAFVSTAATTASAQKPETVADPLCNALSQTLITEYMAVTTTAWNGHPTVPALPHATMTNAQLIAELSVRELITRSVTSTRLRNVSSAQELLERWTVARRVPR